MSVETSNPCAGLKPNLLFVEGLTVFRENWDREGPGTGRELWLTTWEGNLTSRLKCICILFLFFLCSKWFLKPFPTQSFAGSSDCDQTDQSYGFPELDHGIIHLHFHLQVTNVCF